jgi:transcription initiation factor TFIID subunit 7
VEEQNGADAGSPPKKQAKAQSSLGKIRIPSLPGAVPTVLHSEAPKTQAPKLAITTTLPKISFKRRPTSVTTPHIKLKTQGKAPVRPVGVGYDSEAEDVEIDPAIESQVILRFENDENGDCEYLQNAIKEKKLGLPISKGGADVMLRFFEREGRRAMITVRGRHYAAAMLDLPCVIESMKSWDKRGWWKSADVCQILFVLGRCANEEEARKYQLPPEVDAKHWLYPHGLTPPMHWVRKRRFRSRVSYRTIEAVEAEVERLLEADQEVWDQGGTSTYGWVDLDKEQRERELAEEDEEEEPEGEGEGYYGAVVDGYEYNAENVEIEAEEDEEDELAALMQAGLEEAEMEIEVEPSTAAVTPGGTTTLHLSPEALLPTGITSDSGATPASQTQTDTGDEADETGDDVGNEVDEEDEEEIARQQELAQQREEIEDLKKEIAAAEEQVQKQRNPLLQQRAAAKVKSLKTDLQLKLANLGEDGEEED